MPTTPDGTAKVSIPIEYPDRQIDGQMHATDDGRTELAETNAASPFESGLPLPESERGQSSLATCRPLRVVAISDTHGMHRTLKIPNGDVLLHGGDFTSFGKREDVLDFNEWLGTLPHPHKLVVLGNHEANADWVDTASALLTNATLLNESEAVIRRPGDFGPKELCDPGESADGPGRSFRVFGTSFYWPVETGSTCYFTPPYARIPAGIDVLLTHGPPAVDGIDGGMGCPLLLEHVRRLRPRLVVCGHIHQAHGVVEGSAAHDLEGVMLVNAANAGGYGAKQHSRRLGWPVVELELS